MSETLQRTPGQQPDGPRLPQIPGPLETVALAWRRLRRMSSALVLLFAMAAASIIATFVPQEPVIASTVAEWRAGTAGPGEQVARALDALGLFDVFGSWWFGTLTVLLFVSLTGCLLPRYRAFARVVRRPPDAGRNLERLRLTSLWTAGSEQDDALGAAERVLRRRRFRRRRVDSDGAVRVAAERGHWREGGSLLFHTAFYLLLLGILVGHTRNFTGQVNLVEGQAFTDTRLSYDAATAGRFWSIGDHRAFTVRLDDFEASWFDDATPKDFVSTVTYETADGASGTEQVRVNHPVTVDGMKLYQMRFGMAPRVIVREAATGRPLFDKSVLLVDVGGNVWTGTERVPLYAPPERSDLELPQMALDFAFLPDAGVVEGPRGPQPGSLSPRPDNPRLLAELYVGDLGLEQPRPLSELRRNWQPEWSIDQVVLLPGADPVPIAGGALTIEFAELDMWSGFQVSHAAGRWILLVAAVLVLAGLVPSLYAYRRRLWVEVRPRSGGGCDILVAGVTLQRQAIFAEEYAAVVAELRNALPAADRVAAPSPAS